MTPSRSRRRSPPEQGSAELAVATPLLLVLILLVAQVAVWAHGHHTAQTIAGHGLAAARAADASAAQGQAQAEHVADQLSGSLLTNVEVTAERDASTATVRVQARVPSLVPGLDWPVAPEVSGPVERLPEERAAP